CAVVVGITRVDGLEAVGSCNVECDSSRVRDHSTSYCDGRDNGEGCSARSVSEQVILNGATSAEAVCESGRISNGLTDCDCGRGQGCCYCRTGLVNSQRLASTGCSIVVHISTVNRIEAIGSCRCRSVRCRVRHNTVGNGDC